jgi:hypothetical protein
VSVLSRAVDAREEDREDPDFFLMEKTEKEKRGSGVQVQVKLLWVR